MRASAKGRSFLYTRGMGMSDGGSKYMYETLQEHDNDIKEHRERITSLEDITLALKESDRNMMSDSKSWKTML